MRRVRQVRREFGLLGSSALGRGVAEGGSTGHCLEAVAPDAMSLPVATSVSRNASPLLTSRGAGVEASSASDFFRREIFYAASLRDTQIFLKH